MPSSFSSTAHAPSFSTASDTDGGAVGEHGQHRAAHREPEVVQGPGPSASSARATVCSDPASITARRTPAAGAPVASASPSTATASRAPRRTSPVSSPNRNRCSSSVAAARSSSNSRRRSACEPAPVTVPTSVSRASTSRTVSEGSGAGGTGPLSSFQPMPSRPWGRRPARYGITIGTSSASASRNSSASRAVFRDLAPRWRRPPGTHGRAGRAAWSHGCYGGAPSTPGRFSSGVRTCPGRRRGRRRAARR